MSAKCVNIDILQRFAFFYRISTKWFIEIFVTLYHFLYFWRGKNKKKTRLLRSHTSKQILWSVVRRNSFHLVSFIFNYVYECSCWVCACMCMCMNVCSWYERENETVLWRQRNKCACEWICMYLDRPHSYIKWFIVIVVVVTVDFYIETFRIFQTSYYAAEFRLRYVLTMDFC